MSWKRRRTSARRASHDAENSSVAFISICSACRPRLRKSTRSVNDDKSPFAYEMLVDRLLASPRYGERWAQHWLDVVRYAESEGFEYDRMLPGAWRFRDYVIESFQR